MGIFPVQKEVQHSSSHRKMNCYFHKKSYKTFDDLAVLCWFFHSPFSLTLFLINKLLFFDNYYADEYLGSGVISLGNIYETKMEKNNNFLFRSLFTVKHLLTNIYAFTSHFRLDNREYSVRIGFEITNFFPVVYSSRVAAVVCSNTRFC